MLVYLAVLVEMLQAAPIHLAEHQGLQEAVQAGRLDKHQRREPTQEEHSDKHQRGPIQEEHLDRHHQVRLAITNLAAACLEEGRARAYLGRPVRGPQVRQVNQRLRSRCSDQQLLHLELATTSALTCQLRQLANLHSSPFLVRARVYLHLNLIRNLQHPLRRLGRCLGVERLVPELQVFSGTRKRIPHRQLQVSHLARNLQVNRKQSFLVQHLHRHKDQMLFLSSVRPSRLIAVLRTQVSLGRRVMFNLRRPRLLSAGALRKRTISRLSQPQSQVSPFQH